MGFLNNPKEYIEFAIVTKVLRQLDEEKLADYIVQYADKRYPDLKKNFMEAVYMNLLLLVSAVNRRRGK